ncbi:MAG: Sir2 family NAD-dependent protein deacetylase [Clostridia bacterium]|nr:Sir2 family NAD-dependent protein deacetylase [Clostridia bacterium]
MNIKNYLKAKEIINYADAILIGAGAGLSSSAGIDYSKETFKKNFPELVKTYGMTDMYTSSFYDFKTEEERWSYWAKHINYSFIEPKPLDAYKELLEIVKDKDYFVITTNVDGQFLKSGFNQNKVFEVQGSYGKMQCSVGCHNKLYDNTELVKRMLMSKDNLKVDSNLVPFCPVCGKSMEINIRKDAFFVEDENWNNLNDLYEKFINNNINKKLVLIELGVGYNTPSIIRFPFEQLAYKYDNITLIRVNDKYTDIAFELKNQAIVIKDDCKIAIHNILN